MASHLGPPLNTVSDTPGPKLACHSNQLQTPQNHFYYISKAVGREGHLTICFIRKDSHEWSHVCRM